MHATAAIKISSCSSGRASSSLGFNTWDSLIKESKPDLCVSIMLMLTELKKKTTV